jgi:hypothetical protein
MLIHSQRPPINHFASLFSCAIECAATSPLVLYGYGFEWAEVVIEIGLILCQVALALFLLITSCTQPDAASSFSLSRSLARHMTRLYSNAASFQRKQA